MKTKIMKYYSCMLVLLFIITSDGISQQSQVLQPSPPSLQQTASGPEDGTYTYTLFVAPNKVYGYNIFYNGRIIFHQPAMAEPADKRQPSITKKTQADKAALIAIEKIKRGLPADLTGAELIEATAQ